jgi:hypothetical protein
VTTSNAVENACVTAPRAAEDPPAPQAVGGRADGQDRRPRHQREDAEDPLERRELCPEVVAEVRQRDVDHVVVDADQERAEGQREAREAHAPHRSNGASDRQRFRLRS